MVDACNLDPHYVLLFDGVEDADTALERGGVDASDIQIVAGVTARILSRLAARQRQSSGTNILCVGAALTVVVYSVLL